MALPEIDIVVGSRPLRVVLTYPSPRQQVLNCSSEIFSTDRDVSLNTRCLRHHVKLTMLAIGKQAPRA
ncbi:hypothetical protein AMTR_s00081p00171560 [Amborella trichopoda]|uniref:Uncharacterized protein n=1 Tax=Amborella trichopoda TaxID=13333 RepID=W1P9E1_AMBTC|nr:hypothetical protein AMTR_s00081p00171560 [Amborella trichopoda]